MMATAPAYSAYSGGGKSTATVAPEPLVKEISAVVTGMLAERWVTSFFVVPK